MDIQKKRLAKNTIYLYVRMILIMLVTLYTTRIVLKELGIVDYGIYNLVGSVAVSLIFIQNALSSATQRYLSFEIGKGRADNISQVFSMSVNIHLILAFITVICLETIGLWFVNHVLNIPQERLFAANVAYQFSIFTYVVNLLRIPHNALIISNEMMNIYAIISVFEVLIRLLIAFLLIYTSIDKLEFYTGLLFLSSIITNFFYWIFCKSKLKIQCKYKYKTDSHLFKSMTSFLGWNMVGGVVSIAVIEGPGYFINYFCGVTLNAGIGIAKQVSSAVYSLSSNFQSAFNPQIVKDYASEEREKLQALIYQTTVLSYYLLFIIALPFVLCCREVMNMWLDEVPPMTIQFVICMIFSQLLSALGSPLWMTVHASGNIRNYQIYISLINILIIPVSWIVLKLNFAAYYVFIFQVIINGGILLFRTYYLSSVIEFCRLKYFKMLFQKCIIPSVICIPLPLFISNEIPSGFFNLTIVTIISVLSVMSAFYYIVVDSKQREQIRLYVKTLIMRR